MADGGEVHLLVASPIDENPDRTVIAPELDKQTNRDCCYLLPVFGDIADTDPFRNDQKEFIFRFGSAVTGVLLILEKCENGVFVEKVTIVDQTFGAFSDFGVFTADGFKYISLFLEWRTVLSTFGAGTYRIKTDESNILASLDNQNQFSDDYKLLAFTARRAENTVRWETTTSGINGDINDQKLTFTYPDNWKGQLRIKGTFGQDKSAYEQEYTLLQTGREVFVKDKQIESYIFESDDRLPEHVRKYLVTTVLQSTIIEVTDYNTNSANTHVRTSVIKPDGFEPNYFNKLSKLANVGFEVQDAFSGNKRHLRC